MYQNYISKIWDEFDNIRRMLWNICGMLWDIRYNDVQKQGQESNRMSRY